jgi:hypothetical protein
LQGGTFGLILPIAAEIVVSAAIGGTAIDYAP